MRVVEIITLDAEEAENLLTKAEAGDSHAARSYLLWAAWRKIDAQKGYSAKAKVAVLNALDRELDVQWQTASS